LWYGFSVGFRSGIGYRENFLVISETGISVGSSFPVGFGFGKKSSLRWEMGTGMGRFSLDGGRSEEPFPQKISPLPYLARP
jgi:hypothetical protein